MADIVTNSRARQMSELAAVNPSGIAAVAVTTALAAGIVSAKSAAPATVPAKTPALLDGAERILFSRTDSIGDAVIASGMLERIQRKYPQARLAVLCQQPVAGLFTSCPWVDTII